MLNIKKYFSSFALLFYPNYCCSCGYLLFTSEQHICTKCLYKLPKTNFHKTPDNVIAQKFWGKVQVEHATAFYNFQKSLRIQKIMHHLKYRNNTDVGVLLGKLAAIELKDTQFNHVDCIVSIPLHKLREKQRGYNQSDYIAIGLAEGLGKEFVKNALIRNTNTSSQTRKNRFERWKNTENIFDASPTANFYGKHILLVDDVITTGSTLESCAIALKKQFDCKVSIFALAVAS